MLRRDLELHGDDRRLLEVVDEESQRLEGIVADFLRFARPRPIHKTPQDITEILDDLLLLVSQEPRGSKIRIEKGYEPDLPRVELDPAQTREALWNLLINAAEAMPDGGDLHVSVDRSRKGDDFLEVVVTDSGTGISKSEQEKIFQPFHSTKADGPGWVWPSYTASSRRMPVRQKLKARWGKGARFGSDSP